MDTIAVTGGSGRLGRGVVQQLALQGHRVRNLDRVAVDDQPVGDIETMLIDVMDYDAVRRALEGCSAVVHLAANTRPVDAPWQVIYANNTVSSYNVLYAAAGLGIKKVCMASSINATGAAYSAAPRFDYFPLDELHPTYNEDPYSLSKWVLELQGESIARRFAGMTIASLRFHAIYDNLADFMDWARNAEPARVAKNLWGRVSHDASVNACLLALQASFIGHEAFYIVAPTTSIETPSSELIRQFYPTVPLRGDFTGNRGFFDTTKAERMLGWVHIEQGAGR